ncbi:hypothetical protein PCANC_26478 [Puccinia coronata f. sp. avenae]|uniref:VWFA domain-containing protein n=1 Tax=Puccinia coronata f. sp. avenae TaxID=200324 RepID=A0A2N5UE69_9BASI|nr:hypothetical protein PCANC_26478 [Puccinia coronata f. sp. avenae]PLW18474.1 hypothetical protein PCASD_19527 [Puccinia coronata f. sp. avenae]PLW36053.1 hypothetical protein PCASD_16310 [Puccinia coronata f. sp. avenae]
MNAPPPAYSLVDHHQPDARRHSHSVSYGSQPHTAIQQAQQQQTSSGAPTRLGRSSQSLYIRSNNHRHTTTDYAAQPSRRGLGSLIVGLGAASALNSALNQNSHQQHNASPTLSSGEDRLAILARYDTVLLIDDSASMNQQNRWNEAAAAVAGLADTLVRYDNDGIDVYFMNSVQHLRNATSAGDVNRLFQRVQPVGRSTPTDVRVEELLSNYVERLEVGKAGKLPSLKPLNLIVITDGEADDPDTLAYALAGFSDRLEDGRFPLNQLGIQFIQIGNDPNATQFLKSLDDELRCNSSSRRDIVDTTPYQGRVTTDFLIKALLGGINKRIDHQSNR